MVLVHDALLEPDGLLEDEPLERLLGQVVELAVEAERLLCHRLYTT